ncbi:MAG TPA: hypothetical protein VNF27_03125 [Candidatus Binataceae bacterium]|nr:hypothetical protein [Candidatus Binataceae bacterium]
MKAALNLTDDSPSVFSGASILPEQFRSPRRDHRFEGERNLLFAILEDAIRCYLENCNNRTALKRIQYVEAHDWIFSVKDRGPFSFVSVCENLDIEPDSLRVGLRRKHARIRSVTLVSKAAQPQTTRVLHGDMAARA